MFYLMTDIQNKFLSAMSSMLVYNLKFAPNVVILCDGVYHAMTVFLTN